MIKNISIDLLGYVALLSVILTLRFGFGFDMSHMVPK